MDSVKCVTTQRAKNNGARIDIQYCISCKTGVIAELIRVFKTTLETRKGRENKIEESAHNNSLLVFIIIVFFHLQRLEKEIDDQD